MRSSCFGQRYFPALGAAGYFILASTTIVLTSDGRSHATVWPADAVILALILCSTRSAWPAILGAGWIANLCANGVTRGWSAGIGMYGAINMAQILVVALLLQKARSAERPLEDARSTLFFFLFAGLLAPMCGAVAGSVVSLINYDQPFLTSFFRWFASNALGLLLVAPFLKAVIDGRFASAIRNATFQKKCEGAALMTGHAAITAAVFAQSQLPLLFVPVLSLLGISFRLGRLGTKAGVIVVGISGAIAAQTGTGPVALIHADPAFMAIFFQIYLGAILCSALPVAAVVSAREEKSAIVAERAQTLRLIMGQSSDAILCFDREDICRWADGQMDGLLGISSDEAIGRSRQDILDLIGSEAFAEWLQCAGESDGESTKVDFVAGRRPLKTLEASLGKLAHVHSLLVSIVTIRDVSANRAREAAIARMAELDDLTGILNRKGFRAELEEAVRTSQTPLCLALVDVDNFKPFNDEFGHSVGDRVLHEVALRLSQASQPTDVIGRLGGDEFAILFRCDVQTASDTCARVIESLRTIPVIDDGELRLTASISCGIAPWRHGISRGQLFDAADAALYEVKRSGRDGVRAAA